jgi:hypothetical protein
MELRATNVDETSVLFSVEHRRDAKRVRRERAQLAEMHSSSPHRFAVTSFTHGSGGKIQTQQEPKRTHPVFTVVLKTAEKSWERALQGFATESRKTRDAEGESDASVE